MYDAGSSLVFPEPPDTGPIAAQQTFFDLLPDVWKDCTTLIPAELVTLHAISLPVRTARQRQEALPYALEEAISRPLVNTHFAICGTGADKQILAATTEIEMLTAFLDVAPGNILVPEQMALQRPEHGSDGKKTWRAYRREGRVLIRVSDGTGFAVRSDMLHALWQASGRPEIENFGAPLEKTVVATDRAESPLPSPGNLGDADLRQGAFLPDRGLRRPLTWIAASILVAALGHLAITAFDVRAQRAIAEAQGAEARAALATHLPDATINDAPELIRRRLNARYQPQVGSSFLPILDRVSDAILSAGTSVQFRQISWGEDTMRLTMEAPDLDALQRAEASLRAANLKVSSGSATADSGAARAELTVRP